MKTLKFFALVLFLIALVSTAYSQANKGNKISWVEPMTWDETITPIECIGPYTGEMQMHITYFFTGKILNKASGSITDSDGNEYTVESSFNCHLFVRNISASGNSNQAWTFKVRSVDTGKIVATVHFTFHYENFNGEEEGPSFINYQCICH